MREAIAESSARDKNFNFAWMHIDSVIEKHDHYRDYLREAVGGVAAEKSIQAACDWVDEFDRVYRKVAKYPYLRYDIEKRIKALAESDGLVFACAWFRDFELKNLRLNGSFLTVESNDQEVKDEAATMAIKCDRMIHSELQSIKDRGGSKKYRMKSAERLIIAVCTGAGVEIPLAADVGGDEEMDTIAKCARLCCEKWWRKKLRQLKAFRLEVVAREFGMVCKKRGGYCSIATLRRRSDQKRRNRNLLEFMEAENDKGQVWTLAELSDKGVSNPVNRRAELMTRISGFQKVADEIGGFTPVFITQTCPSRFHSNNSNGRRYPNWDGSTPREAQEYLTRMWSQVRSSWKRAGFSVFGFRVAEPHQDGCPHWHMLLWVPSHQKERLVSIYRAYALSDEPPKNAEVRFKVMEDEVAENATGYIAKYISKGVDGLTPEGQAWSDDSVRTAISTEAWASTWGIRQFQQIGGASVTVYREMRRLREEFGEAAEVEAIRSAANNGDWCQYTMEMGGPICEREKRPIRAYMVKKKDEVGSFVKNKYGEFVRKVFGLEAFGFLPIKTRLYEWVVRPVKRGVASFEEAQAPPLDLCQ